MLDVIRAALACALRLAGGALAILGFFTVATALYAWNGREYAAIIFAIGLGLGLLL